MRNLSISACLLLASLASLAITGCAAEAASTDGDELVASEAEAIKASDLYKALTGSYSSSTAPQSFELAADRTFTMDTGARCITYPCDVASDAGKWTLYTYRGRLYLHLSGQSGKTSRWYGVASYTKGTLVGLTDEGTWNKVIADDKPSCAVMLCAVGTICVEGPEGGQCITACATVKCSAGHYCDATSGTASCVKGVCPKTSYVNCMPPLSGDRVKQCSEPYKSWAEGTCGTEFVY